MYLQSRGRWRPSVVCNVHLKHHNVTILKIIDKFNIITILLGSNAHHHNIANILRIIDKLIIIAVSMISNFIAVNKIMF